MLAVDMHQHLWPEGVLRRLEGRIQTPRTRWRDGTWEVRLRREPAFTVRPSDHDPVRRVDELEAAGVDRALVALSSPVAAETVSDAVAAWSDAAVTLPERLGWWAAVPSDVPAPEQAAVAREAIADGAAGLCLPAGALRSLARAEDALPVLREVERHGAPVFVHPGEADGTADDPGWWSPATSYVAQMHVAWHAFQIAVRPALPSLRVVFALLAGLAPLHLERTVGRGAALDGAVDDGHCFYDTSSYGPAAILSMARAVGTGQLVHGTDRPVAPLADDAVTAALGEDTAALVRRENTSRALGYTWLPA